MDRWSFVSSRKAYCQVFLDAVEADMTEGCADARYTGNRIERSYSTGEVRSAKNFARSQRYIQRLHQQANQEVWNV